MLGLGLGISLINTPASGGDDVDASAYIAAVEAADGQALETGVKAAIIDFIVGCKSDGIWDAIKSCCILAGARTLSGALVPLKGTAPTNFNFVSDDYSRRTGLLGNGTTKYLASNRNNNADPQNNRHKAGYITQVSSINGAYFGAGTNNIGSDHIRKAALVFARSVNELQFSHSQPITSLGLYGMSRSSSASYQFRVNGVTDTITNTSQTPYNQNNTVFGRVGAAETNGRMSFYSIGESLDLALLDSRVTTLMSSIDAAIPQSYFVFGETIEYYDFSDEVVPDGMFASRSDLTSAVIADNVVTIGANAFAQCVNLSSVTLSNNLVTIGNNAFALCTSLASITIPDSVTTIVADAFTSCESLAEVTIGSGVTSLPSGVFSDCYSLTNIVIPDNVTSIGEGAFYNCFNLTSVTLSNNLVSIGAYAFNFCTGLTSITIPDSVTSIGDYALSYCFSLTSVTLSNSLTVISDGLFYASGMTSITIPDGVTSIGASVFFTSSLAEIVIPDSVTSIGDYAFLGCGNLTAVTLPNNLTTIGSNAFDSCGLTSITIPDSVTSIGNYAFTNCVNLTSVTLSNSLTTINYGLFQSTLITSITIPDGVTSIGDHAFNGCYGLTAATLPNNLTTIGSYAFSSCGLTSITIPASVTSIGSLAFSGNYGLDTINCYVERSVMDGSGDTIINIFITITLHARATDSTWTAGSDTVGGATVTVVKDL